MYDESKLAFDGLWSCIDPKLMDDIFTTVLVTIFVGVAGYIGYRQGWRRGLDAGVDACLNFPGDFEEEK
jgi:hypothetical protein